MDLLQFPDFLIDHLKDFFRVSGSYNALRPRLDNVVPFWTHGGFVRMMRRQSSSGAIPLLYIRTCFQFPHVCPRRWSSSLRWRNRGLKHL